MLIDNIPAPEGYHIGADLEFGKDGYLYVSTGDGGCQYSDPVWCDHYNAASRDQNVLLGKVLRITRDGAIPPTNPYQGTDSARCAATGHHDPGQEVPGDVRVGTAQPVPDGLRSRTRRARGSSSTTWARSPGRRSTSAQAGADYGWNVREGHCATGFDDRLRPAAGRA